ncbi:hypothetical protein VULLAG_LOCUS1372 [Vulpes lagopus]
MKPELLSHLNLRANMQLRMDAQMAALHGGATSSSDSANARTREFPALHPITRLVSPGSGCPTGARTRKGDTQVMASQRLLASTQSLL